MPMMWTVVIQSFIILEICAILHSTEIYKEYAKAYTFQAAKDNCTSRGLSLLVAPSYDGYSMFEEIFNNDTFPNEFWIGLHKPKNTDEYEWLTGDKLDVFWYEGPKKPHEKKCVVAKTDKSQLWETTECDADDNYFICVDYKISETDYSLNVTEVDYETARDTCHKAGKDLVMIKTRQQYNSLYVFLSNKSLKKDVWIGLEGFGKDDRDYRKYKWIDGEYMNTIAGELKTMADESGDKCIIYKKGKWEAKNCNESHPFICTGHFVRPVPENMTNIYDLVENKRPYIQHLRQTTVKSKSKCATECSKSLHCYMYTYDGLNCELFKKSAIFINNNVPNRKLYIRRHVGSNKWARTQTDSDEVKT